MNLHLLAEPFTADDIEWKPVAIAKNKSKALAAAYVTNRGVMDRLDEVCGPENWKNEYASGPDGGVVCGLSIKVDSEWVTKFDGAENTDIESVKGGLSGAMRRAAVQWGIGRYLYRLSSQWVPVDERGRFTETPQLPAWALPARLPEDKATALLEAVRTMLQVDDVRAVPFAGAVIGHEITSMGELTRMEAIRVYQAAEAASR